MTEYKVEYQCQSKYGNPLFCANKYVDGKLNATLKNYSVAVDCHEYIKRILEGEGSYIMVPYTVKEIKFRS